MADQAWGKLTVSAAWAVALLPLSLGLLWLASTLASLHPGPLPAAIGAVGLVLLLGGAPLASMALLLLLGRGLALAAGKVARRAGRARP